MNDSLVALQTRVQRYIERRDWSRVPVMAERRFAVRPLAQGEYNRNFLLDSGDLNLVLRINVGSQIARDDQILYEFKALQLMQRSGVTPIPYFVDPECAEFPRGLSIMQFLPGRPLDYTTDLDQAAALLARVHQVPVTERDNHLIREDAPLDLIYRECEGLLQAYFDSDLADPDIRAFLAEVRDWARQARAREHFFQADPWPCIVNTEVNSGNFIVNPDRQSIHLVDWEMPRWGDPSQDLCHFCSPLTTLWKTTYRMTLQDKAHFMQAYAARMTDRHLRDTLCERVRLRDPFVHLRGISWSAMGWVAYQTDFGGIRNAGLRQRPLDHAGVALRQSRVGMQKQECLAPCGLRTAIHLPGPAGETRHHAGPGGRSQGCGIVTTAAVHHENLNLFRLAHRLDCCSDIVGFVEGRDDHRKPNDADWCVVHGSRAFHILRSSGRSTSASSASRWGRKPMRCARAKVSASTARPPHAMSVKSRRAAWGKLRQSNPIR